MVCKKFWLGMLVIVLVFGFIFTGCELFEDPEFTFEFMVENVWNGTITQIDFLNGDGPSAPVLQTETVHLSTNDKTSVYKISGFTMKPKNISDDYHYRYFAVRITYEDGTRCGGVDYAENKSKIKVNVDNIFAPPMLFFREGDW